MFSDDQPTVESAQEPQVGVVDTEDASSLLEALDSEVSLMVSVRLCGRGEGQCIPLSKQAVTKPAASHGRMCTYTNSCLPPHTSKTR